MGDKSNLKHLTKAPANSENRISQIENYRRIMKVKNTLHSNKSNEDQRHRCCIVVLNQQKLSSRKYFLS